ncbi:type VII secretion-associated serine protease mycosin [Streptomyces sp. HB2AG]|uniref:type VII secretion-associated serine protease mycosin n=1 Tax=Streptomyces sp. HB2AG TaxID=2983400 RepID=UPI0022AA17DF|nr:type VII secretion-associated serine protease mycosin [Streptomyces sp. HB2AG]MCZ2524343.1 type VII secretion-associated serine protease mycosin [Streptomyces sp. HB2AG]
MGFAQALRAVCSTALAGTLLFSAAPAASADSIRDDQWALKAFNAEKVWAESTGKGVTVAVIDNGVNGLHPDLVGNVLEGKSFVDDERADRQTSADHGTAMASIIAAHGHGPGNGDGVIGLAPDAKILPLKDSNEDNPANSFTEGAGSSADLIRYAVDHGASVINMSFGGALREGDEEAIAYAAEHDVVLVSATGNLGSDSPSYPAAAPGVVAVGAVDKSGQIWEDSNYGPHVMLTAPGVYIRAAGGKTPYRLSNGTSDATAYVSGAVALLRAKFPDLTAGQIVNRLVKTAALPEDMQGKKLPDERYGYGIIRPYRALTEDIPAGPKQGPLKTPSAAVAEESAAAAAAEEKQKAEEAVAERNSRTNTILAVVGGGLLLLVAAVVVVVVVRRRGKDRNGGPPPGGPWTGGPGAGPGPGNAGWPQQHYGAQQGGQPYADGPNPYRQ